MGNIEGVKLPSTQNNNINHTNNSNNSYNSILPEAYDFYYESEDMFIPETEEEITENNTNLQDDITELTNTNNELEIEKKRLESLKEKFNYDEELRYKYELKEDAAGRIMDPYDYECRERLENSLAYKNPDGTFNEELLQEAVADYTDRYNKALSESTNGEFTDIDILNEKTSKIGLDIATNNESIRLKTKEQQEASYDDKALSDCFKDNMSNEKTYKDKLADLVTEGEKCSDVISSILVGVPTASNAEIQFKESTGKDISAYDLLECIAEEQFGISPEKLRRLTAEEAEELIQNLQNNGYYWAVDAYNTYKYLNDKQLAMIKTITDEDGIQAASEYYECIEEKITSLQGMEDAIGFFNDLLEESGYNLDDVKILINRDGDLIVYTIDENGEYVENYELSTNIQNVLRSFGEGVEDGVIGFFDGLANAISTSKNKSRVDYKKLYIAYFLSKNVILKGSYDVGNGVGNLLPSMAVNALFGFAGAPVALQSNLGYIMLGISAYGSSRHEYEVNGITGSKALIGSIMKGLLEYITGKMFGRIPWLNEEATLALSEYFKTGSNIFTSIEWGQLLGAIADNMAHEGMEEFIQAYFEAGIDTFATGEPYEIKETTKEALYSFLIGALTSGILSGSNVAIDFTFNDVEYHMTQQEIEDFLSNVESTQEITALNIFTTMKKYDCSVEIAQTILDKKLNDEQASALVEIHKNDPSIDVKDILPSIILDILKLQKIAMAEGMTLNEYGSQTSDSQVSREVQAEADALAAIKHAEAELAEPQISEDMKSLENDQVHLEGFDQRLKKESTMSSKIISDYNEQSIDNPNLTLEEVSNNIGDSLRYTLICNPDTFTSDVQSSLLELLEKGYKLRKLKNNVKNPNYKGVNVSLIAPDGSYVELQFHTEQSYKNKQNIGHLVYEIARNEYVSPEAKQIANRLRKQIASETDVPEGVENLTKESIEELANKEQTRKIIEEVKKIQNMTDEELPDEFYSIREYKRYFVDKILENYGINSLDEQLLIELCKDSTMIDELVDQTDIVEEFIIECHKNKRLGFISNIISKEYLLGVSIFFKQLMQDYINTLPEQEGKLLKYLLFDEYTNYPKATFVDYAEELNKVKNITEEELPNEFDSIEEYKRNYIDDLLDRIPTKAMDNQLLEELCKDPIFLNELIKQSDIVGLFIIDNYRNDRNSINNDIFANLSLETIQELLNESEVKKNIQYLKPKQLASFINDLYTIYGNQIVFNSSIVDAICELNVVELEDFCYLYYEYRFDEYSTSKDNIEELLINPPVLPFFPETTDPQSLEKIEKIYEYLQTRIYTEKNMVEIATDMISPLFLPSSYDSDSTINDMIQELKAQEINLKKQVCQKIKDISEIELEENDNNRLIYKVKEKSYVDVVFEIDGKEKIFTIYTDSSDFEIEELILNNEKLITELKKGTLIIKSINQNERLSSMILSEKDGLVKGLNHIKYTVDGEKIDEVIDFNDRVDLSYKYPEAKEIKLINVEPIGRITIPLTEQDADSFYELKYMINGEEKIAYITPKRDSEGNVYLNIGEFIANNGLTGLTVDDIEVSKVDKPEIDMSALQDLSSFDEIFGSSDFGGDQSNVSKWVEDYIMNPISTLPTMEQIKAKQLIDMIKTAFPNATDMEIIDIADAYAEGGCYYMAIANAFAAYMGNLENGESIFKDRMGFDLKTTANGETSYNLEAIALDIFLKKAIRVTEGKISKISNAIGVYTGEEKSVFIDYFKEKGIEVECSYAETVDSIDKYNQLLAHIMSNQDSIHILLGNIFDLELYDDASSISSPDAALANASRNGSKIDYIGAHAIIITDANENEMYVSTWAQKAKLSSSNFRPGRTFNFLDIISFSFKIEED